MAEQTIKATEDELRRIQEQLRKNKELSDSETQAQQIPINQSIPASVFEENIIEQTPITQDNWWQEDSSNLYRNVFQDIITDTITFGLSEEASSGMLSFIDKIKDIANGGNTPYSDFYRQNVSNLENQRLAWQQENPLATTAATIIGIGGSLGQAPKTAQSVLSRIPGASNVISKISPRIAQVTEMAAPVTQKISAITPQAVKTLVSGAPQAAAYGGLAGLGYSLQGEDAEQAAFDGAKTAILLNTAFRGLGTSISALSKRRVERELGKGKDFVPLIAAGDSGLAKIYNSITKNLPIAGGRIQSQLENFKKPLITEKDKLFAEIQERTGISQLKSINNYVEKINTRLKGTSESIKNKTTKGIKLDPEKELEIQRRYQTVESARSNVVQAILNTKEKLFRTNIVKSSATKNLNSDDLDTFDKIIGEGKIQKAISFLENTWAEKGFGVIKNRNFTIDIDEFINSINRRIGDSAESFALLYGDRKINFGSTIESFLEGKLVGNTITGKAISDLRTKYSREVRNLINQGGESAQRGFVLKNVLDEITDSIEKQLPQAEKKLFEEERKAWRVYVNLLDATASASTKGGARGAFTEDQWLQALKRNQPKYHVKGQGDFQGAADSLSDVRDRVGNISNKIAQNTKQRMSIALNLEKQKVKESLANAITNPTGTEIENARLMESYTDTLRKIDEIDVLLKSGNPTVSNWVGSMLATTGILFGGSGSIISGGLIAGMIGSQGFQRFLAGQTAAQKAVSDIASKASTALGKGAAVVSGQAQAGGLEKTTPLEYRAIANSKNNQAKALAFKRVLELGQEDKLKRTNRDAYTKLKSAYESVYSR